MHMCMCMCMQHVHVCIVQYVAYFRNRLTSGWRACFRLNVQLSQSCAQTLHIFAHYYRLMGTNSTKPRTPVCRKGEEAVERCAHARGCVATGPGRRARERCCKNLN